MNHKFTEEIGQWLNTPEEERDYKAGALLLLKLSGNQIMYLINISNPEGRREFIPFVICKVFPVKDLKVLEDCIFRISDSNPTDRY